MADKKGNSPKKARNTKKKQSQRSVSIHIEGDVKDGDIIIGDGNRVEKNTVINRIRNITHTIIQRASPRDYFVYSSVFLVVLSAISYLFWYNNLRYDRAIASGRLNVLIVPFVEEKVWGYGKSDLGWTIAQIFADGVEESFAESGIDAGVKILGPSDKVPTIFGFHESHLGSSAETVSEKVNGQILIYGVISEDEYGDKIVSVKVYISPKNFGEAQELISDSMMGELSLGSFRLTGDTASGADLLAQNKELRERLEIFSSIINFLGAYVGEDFARAEGYIADAENETLWSNTNGLEVVYLVHGNMQIRQARVAMVNKDLEQVLEITKQAKQNFEKANDISLKNGKGRYVRAYLGLAGAEGLIAVAEANIKIDVSLIDTVALERSLDYFEEAQNAEYQPETADVTVKVNYGKAQVTLAYFAKTGDIQYLEEAELYYQLVIHEYEETGNERITEYAALSHSGIGHISRQNGVYENAIEHFLSAQKITINPSLKIQCLANVGDIYFKMEDYEKALKYYEDVLSRRNDLENALSGERIAEIEERVKFIKGGGSL
jgi:tetratricopeptide (TPR) repeat protein